MKKYFRLLVIFLVFSCLTPHIASAQVVSIPDANLEAALRELFEAHNVLGPNQPITRQHMAGIIGLPARERHITDLTGLEYATNIQRLFLSGNQISDITPLTQLTQLQVLDLSYNKISDISPLRALTQLRLLELSGNEINNISPLSGLTRLEELFLHFNKTSNVVPLRALTQLRFLALDSNGISDVRPLSGLTQLMYLFLNLNKISDVEPLSGLTQLVNLQLAFNHIQDVSSLAKLVNLETLRLSVNPITDTSPLASLTKLVDVDVKITAPPPVPQPIPEDPTQPSPEPVPQKTTVPVQPSPEPVPQETTVPVQQETAEAPQDAGTQPQPPTPVSSTIVAGQITFSELMYATTGGLFSHPQWIELYNNSAAASVNLEGWTLVVEARDSETRHRYSILELEALEVGPTQTVLLVTRDRRSSDHLSKSQVYNLYRYHSGAHRLGLRENAVLPASGFLLRLFAPDGTLIDSAGNLDGRKRTKDTPMWELPSGWTEDRERTSLIRQYEDDAALPGTEAMSWGRAADVEISPEMYYGNKTDIGTPGYRSGGAAPVMLSGFSANRTNTSVIIEWTTASEIDNAGFNILRGQTKDGSFVKVNPTLIPGAGTTAERQTYTWTDTTAKPNVAYYYQIEDVSFSGNRQPLATVRMKGYVSANGKFTTTWSELKVQD